MPNDRDERHDSDERGRGHEHGGRALGDSRVVARVPVGGNGGTLGYPEGICVDGDRMFVGTPASFETAGAPPSVVLVYDLEHGGPARRWELQGELLAAPHGMSGMAVDARGRLYVLSTQLGVVRFSFNGHDVRQEIYAPGLPDLKPANTGASPPTSPTAFDRPPLSNDLAFDEAGWLYVTDSFQATVWRIPPGGGAPEPWLQDARLDTTLGPNGIRLTPDRRALLLASTTSGFGPLTAPSPGYIFRVPLQGAPALQPFHTFSDGGAPDGMAFGESGRLYVALAMTNQIAVLDPQGNELVRYNGPAQPGAGLTAPVPWDNPASVAFDDTRKRLVVTNHALISGNVDHFVVFDVYVGERGLAQVRPELP